MSNYNITTDLETPTEDADIVVNTEQHADIFPPPTNGSTYHCPGFLSFRIIGRMYLAILFLLPMYLTVLSLK